MSNITLEEAQAHLPEIIAGMSPGEAVVITHEGHPVARLTTTSSSGVAPKPGRCRGMLTIVTEDEEHLKDFAEYMP